MTDYDHGYSDGYQQARADMHDNVEPMIDVADRFAHRLAMHLELFLSDYGGKYYTDALNTLSEYRSAMNAIHEKHCPTFMGEPVATVWEKFDGSGLTYSTPNTGVANARKISDLYAKREHITDRTPCWCNPETTYISPETGGEVIVHKEPQ